jgi:hypothetical protein
MEATGAICNGDSVVVSKPAKKRTKITQCGQEKSGGCAFAWTFDVRKLNSEAVIAFPPQTGADVPIEANMKRVQKKWGATDSHFEYGQNKLIHNA